MTINGEHGERVEVFVNDRSNEMPVIELVVTEKRGRAAEATATAEVTTKIGGLLRLLTDAMLERHSRVLVQARNIEVHPVAKFIKATDRYVQCLSEFGDLVACHEWADALCELRDHPDVRSLMDLITWESAE